MNTSQDRARSRGRNYAAKPVVAAAVLLALAAVPVPAVGQTMLDRLLNAATKKKATPPAAQAPVATGRPAGEGSVLASATLAQQAALDRLVVAPLQDPAIAGDRAAAAPLIRTLVATGACATNGAAWNALNRQRLEPKTYYGNWAEANVTPMFAMRYHDKRRCLDVARLGDWSKPARNALAFRARYVSEASGEAGTLLFVMQKDADGTWLLRELAQ